MDWSHTLFTLAGHDVSVAMAGVVVLLLVLLLWRRRTSPEGQLRVIAQTQAEAARRMDRQLGELNKRMGLIDGAQANVTQLATRMGDLTHILSDKQARGAFGEARMEAIVADALPRRAYTFQGTLSNGRRPDCLIALPGNGAGRTPMLAVDAKFPLEAWRAFDEARDDAAAERALKRLSADVARHVGDVAAKYLVPGETQDVALMFVPSEAVFADLHAHLPDLLERANHARVAIVSPTLLLLAVQVVQSLSRHAAVGMQAHAIQAELRQVAVEMDELGEAVRKLQSHHEAGARDLERILAATARLRRRGARLDALDFDPRRDRAA